MMSIKHTIIGSKIVSFKKDTNFEKWVLKRDVPVNPFTVKQSEFNPNYYMFDNAKEITVLQVVYEDKIYLVEFIEKE